VFTADPRIVPDARKIPQITFEEMLEMAASGAGVLQLRSVEYARNHGVQIHCRSSFHERPGTVVVGEDVTVEQPLITAVTHSTGEARVTLLGVPDQPGVAGRIFTALADANVNVDMIIQTSPVEQRRRRCRSPSRRTTAPARARPSSHPPSADRRDRRTRRWARSRSSGRDEVPPGVAAKVFRPLGARTSTSR
jgi:aspartate kinase